MEIHGPRDGADRARARTVFRRRVDSGFDKLWMIGQPQIVVAGEVDHLAAVHARYRFARGFEQAQALIRAGFSPRVQLLAKPGKRIRRGHMVS